MKVLCDCGLRDVTVFLFVSFCFQANDVELVSTSSESRLFVCEYPDCSAVRITPVIKIFLPCCNT
jgi:hypothetical protein